MSDDYRRTGSLSRNITAPIPYQRIAHGLKTGRPDNRRYRYNGDRRDMVSEPRLFGPDAHGVYWWPIRCYYEDGKTLVVFEPVHPSQLQERMMQV